MPNRPKLFKPTDMLMPSALLIAALMGRGNVAFKLYLSLLAVRILGLSSAPGLRIAIARQPSMRYVQGSAILALGLQIIGAGIALLLSAVIPSLSLDFPLILCGLLLNIEHVFYEYLYAMGDRPSAAQYRSVSAILTLSGLLLCVPPAGPGGASGGALTAFASGIDHALLIVPLALSALIGLIVALSLGGRPRPRFDRELLRIAPLSTLGSLLFPALCLIGMALLKIASPVPLFAGLTLCEACRTPFRRSPLEARPMNRALLACCAAAAVTSVLCVAVKFPHFMDLLAVCGAVLLAAACAFTLYGNKSA